jgi:hypothetical protein
MVHVVSIRLKIRTRIRVICVRSLAVQVADVVLLVVAERDATSITITGCTLAGTVLDRRDVSEEEFFI